jgi:hypothetical protein
MDKCRRAVRLLELRAQVTVAVHGLLQKSNASGCAQPKEDIWLHTMYSSTLRSSLHVLIGMPTVSALNHLVELMERQESSAKGHIETRKSERSPKRQRSCEADESLDDSSTTMPGILVEDKEAISWNLEGVYNSSWYDV